MARSNNLLNFCSMKNVPPLAVSSSRNLFSYSKEIEAKYQEIMQLAGVLDFGGDIGKNQFFKLTQRSKLSQDFNLVTWEFCKK